MSTSPVSRTMAGIWLLGAALAAGACEGKRPGDLVAPAAVTIQLGRALRESGSLTEAVRAFREGLSTLDPANA